MGNLCGGGGDSNRPLKTVTKTVVVTHNVSDNVIILFVYEQ